MELVQVQDRKTTSIMENCCDFNNDKPVSPSIIEIVKKPFIVANTKETSLSELKHKCIIPVFSKDNERAISHQEFIEVTQNCVSNVFQRHHIDLPEIRVSHDIKGRIPEAINKPARDLLEHEKTQYFERMAFIIRIPSIIETIGDNRLSLVVGGVRAYNHENLYSRKSIEKFKVFIGFQNYVCMNLCISTDGYKDEIRVSNYVELQTKITELIQSFSMDKQLQDMQDLQKYSLTEIQFAQLIGKTKLYQHLPKKVKVNLPQLLLTDGHINTIAKDYYHDDAFSRDNEGNINLWKVYNLFTSANKSSYIDTFLGRNENVYNFSNGFKTALNSKSNYSWFLS